jgi:hypothetical protein
MHLSRDPDFGSGELSRGNLQPLAAENLHRFASRGIAAKGRGDSKSPSFPNA